MSSHAFGPVWLSIVPHFNAEPRGGATPELVVDFLGKRGDSNPDREREERDSDFLGPTLAGKDQKLGGFGFDVTKGLMNER